MINEKFSSEFKELLQKPLDPTLFPVKTGDRINIGSYSIRCQDGMYSIKSYKSNKIIAETFTKTAAVAAAKCLNKDKDISTILKLDDIAAKHRTDCLFYKHTLKKTTNNLKWEATWVRYDISKTAEQNAINKIKQFIW